ncbi:MAG TPA: serine/threonine-protein kinase, partial [Pyrinomonadaceae bacterium]
MTPELFRKLERLFHRAGRLPAGERGAYLDRECAGDDELRRQVEEMLASSSDLTDDPLSIPVAELVGRIFAGGASNAEGEGGTGWHEGEVILGLYEVKGLVGRGGMGRVYRVRHTGWNIDLAMKVPRDEIFQTHAGREDFIREAGTWVGLGFYPHVVSCHYVRQAGGVPLVFAEYVGGGSLSDWIRSGRLYAGGPQEALRRILDIAIQCAWGLRHAHEHGLVHRDVKPANVMMTAGGVAKVTDFGLSQARFAAGEHGRAAEPVRSVNVPGVGFMTPAYCSPEQASGAPPSPQTDVWSWAVSVLEMFTGGINWASGAAAAEALARHLKQGAQDARIPAMPRAVGRLLRLCFRDDPAKRPRGMARVAERLRDCYRETTGGDYPRPSPETARALADGL